MLNLPRSTHANNKSRVYDDLLGRIFLASDSALAFMIIFVAADAGSNQHSTMNKIAGIGLLISIVAAFGTCILAGAYERFSEGRALP